MGIGGYAAAAIGASGAWSTSDGAASVGAPALAACKENGTEAGMEVTVLGSSGTYASAGDACAGYLFTSGAYRLLLDIGPGVLSNLQRHCAIPELDALVVTHAHPDHWLDLPGLRNALKYVFRRTGLPVIAPRDVIEQATALLGPEETPTFSFIEVADGAQLQQGPMALRFSATNHPGQTLATLVDDGRVRAAFSADTGPDWSMDTLGREPDLAIIESTYVEANLPSDGGLHLTASQAGAMGRLAAAKRLMVTHFLPGTDRHAAVTEATNSFGQPVTAAQPHLTVAV